MVWSSVVVVWSDVVVGWSGVVVVWFGVVVVWSGVVVIWSWSGLTRSWSGLAWSWSGLGVVAVWSGLAVVRSGLAWSWSGLVWSVTVSVTFQSGACPTCLSDLRFGLAARQRSVVRPRSSPAERGITRAAQCRVLFTAAGKACAVQHKE